MKQDKFKKLLEKGEIAREKRNYSSALAIFDRLLLDSGKQNQWADFAEVLGHRIVIDIHFWQTTEDPGFLEMMQSDVDLGLKICQMKKLPKRYLAVFQLRMGDVLIDKKKFGAAVLWNRRAVKSLNKESRNIGYGEYLTRLGKALVLANKKQESEKTLLRGLGLIKKDKEVRPFRRLVSESSALFWLAIAIKEKNPKKSKEFLKQAFSMAKELKNKYNMPMRLKQFQAKKKEYNL